MKKVKFEVLKKQLNGLTEEISLKEEQISQSLNYGITTRLKKEIAGLKFQQINLLRKIEERAKQKSLIKSRARLKTIGFKNGSRTVML